MTSFSQNNEYMTSFMKTSLNIEKQNDKDSNLTQFVAESQIQQSKHDMNLLKDLFGGKTDSEEELRRDIDYDLKDNNDKQIDADTSEWEEDW